VDAGPSPLLVALLPGCLGAVQYGKLEVLQQGIGKAHSLMHSKGRQSEGWGI